MSQPIYKGFTHSHLEWAFNVSFDEGGVTVPYYGVNGDPYREKHFSAEGKPLRWLGEGKPQIPYGLETLRKGGEVAMLTEGESCAWALRVAFPSVPVLAVPGASSWKQEWRPLVAQFPIVYLSFDADEAGESLLESVCPEVPQARRIALPEGRDTRDVLQLYGGIEEYERLIADADYMAGLHSYFLEIAEREKEGERVAA